MPYLLLRACIGIGLFVAISAKTGLIQAQSQQPTPAPGQSSEQQLPLPVTDLVVEVVAALPLRDEVTNVTRLLGKRQTATRGDNDYESTILELIHLVEPNPQKPSGRRSWKSISLLEIDFDQETREMIVRYCVEKCSLDQQVHPKRKMISYRASEDTVSVRVAERVAELQSVELPVKTR